MSDATPPPPPSGGYPPPPGGGYPPPGGGGYPPPQQRMPGPDGYDLGEGFSWAWGTFTQNVLYLLVGFLILNAIQTVLGFFVNLPSNIAQLGENPESPGIENPGLLFGGLGITGIVGILVGFVLFVLTMNYLRGLLQVVDGQQADIAAIFRFTDIGQSVLLALLLGLGTFVGLALCIIPGIVFVTFAVFAVFFHTDRGQGATQAIGSSFALAKENLGAAFLLTVVSFLLYVAGLLVCLVGTLVTVPLAWLLIAYAYRTLSGGTVAPAPRR